MHEPLAAKCSRVPGVNMFDNPRDEEVEREIENEWEVFDDGGVENEQEE